MIIFHLCSLSCSDRQSAAQSYAFEMIKYHNFKAIQDFYFSRESNQNEIRFQLDSDKIESLILYQSLYYHESKVLLIKFIARYQFIK